MTMRLDDIERLFVRQVAEVVAQEIREQVAKELTTYPVLWSKQTTAYMIGGDKNHASVRFVEDLIADGQIEAIRTGLNGGGRTMVVPESVEAWKQRERLKRRSP